MTPSRIRLSLSLLVAAASGLFLGTVALRAQAPGQAAPTGPLAPEKYKNIQVLTDVPADQLELTMQYFVQATGINCQGCHVTDPATHAFAYDKDDSRTKKTARQMISLVKTVNGGNFGVRIQCATCHGGHNQPAGLGMAVPYTDDQLAAMAAQAARQSAPPPAGGAATPAGGRGQAPAGPAVDDVVAKYLDAIGGRAALEKIQSLSMTGTLTNRERQSSAVTVEAKGDRIRETLASPGVTKGFDGTTGWSTDGTMTADLSGFALLSIRRAADATLPLELTKNYQLQSGRPRMLPGTQTSVNILQGPPLVAGTPVPNATETFYFDATSGLLVRRTLAVRTPMGTLQEQTDFGDYRAVSGVKIPFDVKVTTPQTIDALSVKDVKLNGVIADARFARPKG
jgi:hypothetical protein